MRIGRAIIIPAILALGAAGPIVAGSAAPLTAAAYAPSIQVQKAPIPWVPGVFYHT